MTEQYAQYILSLLVVLMDWPINRHGRSEAYRKGAIATLKFRVNGVNSPCPYPSGDPQRIDFMTGSSDADYVYRQDKRKLRLGLIH